MCCRLGDLNYRLSLSDLPDVFRKIEERNFDYLLSYDQLLSEKSKGNAFKYFKEGLITFAPTYKYQPGSNLYERRPDKKQRCPAYCDRIQWISDDVVQLSYTRCENLKISDHKPVSACFEIGAKEVIKDRKRIVYDSLIRQLDSWENQAIPKVDIRPAQVDLGLVRFDEIVRKSIVIENTGSVTVVEFHFVPKAATGKESKGGHGGNGLLSSSSSASSSALNPPPSSCSKPYLKIVPEMGIIPPHESLEISIECCIGSSSAHAIQTGVEALEDILILALENGADYFVPVGGDYQKSCFGSTIEYLVNTPSPVRFGLPTKEVSQVLSLPKEIWRMVDALYARGMKEERLFVTSGEKAEIDAIRDDLDTGAEFGKYSIHSMAEALIYFLNSLAEPIFPPSIVEQYAEGTNLTTFCKQALLLLTPAHYNAFIYLVSFLRECLKYADSNKLTPVQLVLVFAGCLMHCQVEGREREGTAAATSNATAASATNNSAATNPKAWVILRHYLTSEEFV